jgi:hypothetical protein
LFIITQTLSTATDTSAAWWSADAGTRRELTHWLRASPPNAGFRIVLDLPGDRTNSPNSEPIQIKLCSEFRERVEPRRWRTSEAGSASPNPPSRADDASSGPMSDRLSGQPRSTHICAGDAKRLGVPEGAMSNVRNWASTAVVASLILLAPIIAFTVVITVEMLGDVVARAGATAIWPVLAVGMAWVLLRKFGGQPDTSRLRSGGA